MSPSKTYPDIPRRSSSRNAPTSTQTKANNGQKTSTAGLSPMNRQTAPTSPSEARRTPMLSVDNNITLQPHVYNSREAIDQDPLQVKARAPWASPESFVPRGESFTPSSVNTSHAQ
ncbi:hypothetical protein FHL15_008450 [Xylaria flabelliformis]|uniref:Uncharacterized protein n=1 Tax=Xylaria flabelliformis TaxID=2512241 RepID=A0A553HRU1_9PEZI|nr:hypothetical protein FHL15_008450 [Xylaria flabelliformis]